MQDVSENISEMPSRIRDVIAQTGLSQAKFAALIEEDTTRLKNVLRGLMRPPSDMIQKIIERCDVDVTWLMTGRTMDIGETSPSEKILVENYRSLPATEQGVVQRIIAGLASSAPKKRGRAA